MEKKIIYILLVMAVLISMSVTSAFAETGNNEASIKNGEQMKAAIASAMKDGQLSNKEAASIIAVATDEAVSQLIQEKLDKAVVLLNQMDQDVQYFPGGMESKTLTYDLGDGCQMTVELSDQAEGIQGTPMAAADAGVWKAYGNRYFTAKTTVSVAGYSVVLIVENHYILSAKGIDENYGKVAYDSKDNKCRVSCSKAFIEDSYARTPGASDVNLYGTFTCQVGTTKSQYKLDTTVQYLEHDTSGKRIKVGHTWKLTKLS